MCMVCCGSSLFTFIGAPADELELFEHVIIIGSGIGITPYAGWMLDIKNSQTIDLHWLVKNPVSFTWFTQLLNNQHKDQAHLTTYITEHKAKTVCQHTCRIFIERCRYPTNSIITGLKCETRFGRPNLSTIFQTASNKLSVNFAGRIGVFFCGPIALGVELADRCQLERRRTGKKWEFVGETF